MNFNCIKQQIEIKIIKNKWHQSLLLVSVIYLLLFYFNFTAYIGDYLEEEKYGFCIHCNGSVMYGTCKCAETLLHWIVKWWQLFPFILFGTGSEKSKYDTAPPEWQFSEASYEIANQVCMHNATVMLDMAFLSNTQINPTDLDKQVVIWYLLINIHKALSHCIEC